MRTAEGTVKLTYFSSKRSLQHGFHREPEKTADVSRGRHLSPRKTTFCREGIFFQPIRSTTKIWVVDVISMEFLSSLLRRRFARAQVAT